MMVKRPRIARSARGAKRRLRAAVQRRLAYPLASSFFR